MVEVIKTKEGLELVSKADYDKLAAEFLAYQNAHPQPFGPEMDKALDAYEKEQDDVPEKGMLSAFFILRGSIVISEEQVTSAIAELKAQGVEEMAANLAASPFIGCDAYYMRQFAANLRAGATS